MTDEQWAKQMLAVKKHYDHAVQKHPAFTDRIFACPDGAAEELKIMRTAMRLCVTPSARMLLKCEVLEVAEAISRKDWTQAEYEIYDCVAVLLRILEMVHDNANGKEVISMGCCKGGKKKGGCKGK